MINQFLGMFSISATTAPGVFGSQGEYLITPQSFTCTQY